MITQQQMTESHVIALWIGQFDSFEDFDSYMMSPFEEAFGFHLNERSMPEISEPNGTYFPIRELLSGFSFYNDWIDAAIAACEEKKLREAKGAAVFHHLRYRSELERCNGSKRMMFVANIPWGIKA